MLLLLLNNIPSVSLEVSLLSNSNSFYNSSVNTGTQSLPSVGNSPLAGTPIAGSFFKTALVYTLTTSLFDNSKLVAPPKGGATNFSGNIFGSNGFAGAFSNSYYANISVLTTTAVVLYPSTISSSNIIYSSTISGASQVISIDNIIPSTNIVYSSSIFSTTALTSSLFVNVNSTYTNSLTTFKTLTGTTYTNNNTTYSVVLQHGYYVNPGLYTNTNYYYTISLQGIILYSLRTYIPSSKNNVYTSPNKSKNLKPLSKTNYSVSVKSNGEYSSYSRNIEVSSFSRTTKLKPVSRDNKFIGKKTVSTSSTSYVFKASSRSFHILKDYANKLYKPVHYFVDRLINSKARNNVFIALLNNYFKFTSKNRSNKFSAASRSNKFVATSRTRKYLTGKRVI